MIAAIALIATGCGPKGVNDALSDLKKETEKMTGYKLNAEMTLQTGEEPQRYDVEVWHQKPDFYRVALTSKTRDVTQIILRNEEGVFLLTPHLNKSFRFNSSWPENYAQFYLYESLAKTVLEDDEREFAEDENHYSFHVKADYQNKSLTSQQIVFTKDFQPVKIDVMDANKNVMVTVNFTHFEKNAAFDDDSFAKERNMEASKLRSSLPTMAHPLAEERETTSFGVIQPSYMPDGVNFLGVEKIDGIDGPQLVLRYKGEYNYTLIEERPKATTVSFPSGEIIDLGHTLAALVDERQKTLNWTYDGVEFLLVGDLPLDEMIEVAKSTFNQVGK